MKILVLAVLLFAALPASASSPLAGRLDIHSAPTLGGWQSVKSVDQAFGLSKRFFHLDYSDQPLINISLFGGASKPLLTNPSGPVRFLAGDIVQVPGSVLDFALGTNWGSQWLPKLKTGVLFAHDLSRIAKTHLFGDFIGIGAAYPLGGN